MRILICNNRYFPSSGPERYLFAVTHLLERYGHTVVPLAANYAQTLDTPYRGYFVPPPVDADSVYFRQYKDKLTLRRRVALFARATYYRAARDAAERAIREQRIDLVYALNTVNVLSPSVIDAACAQNVPVVMRLSDFNLLCPAYAFLRDGHVCQECLGGYQHALRHRCLQGSLAVTGARVLAMSVQNALGLYERVSAFIAPSRYMAKQMERFGPARGRIHYIPSFVDPELLDASAGGDSSGAKVPAPVGERPYILFYGRVAPDKGVEVVLRAYAGLERPVSLFIAGEVDPRWREHLSGIMRSLDLSDVHFPGFVQGEPLAALIRDALLVVVPSVCHDNAPMTVYESMAYGKAIVGSDIGGISDQLADGAGVLVPPGDPEALRGALRGLIDDGARRQHIERAARDRLCVEYAPERHYERLMAVFQTARGGPVAHRSDLEGPLHSGKR